jgi:DNA repair exonuclease SbcCD ATPase subunit
VAELSATLGKVQALLKQRDAAVSSLTAALDAARARPGSGKVPPLALLTPKGPLSRQNSDEEALVAEVTEKAQRIRQLEAELAEVKSKAAEMTPRRLTRRESVEDSGVAVVGGGASLSSYEANRLRTLTAECASWRDRSESLMAQVKELQRAQQASELEKAQLADSAGELSEKCAGLEESLRVARESLSSLRAVADQGRGELKSELQRRDSDLSRMAAQQESQAGLVEELKVQVEKQAQERQQLVLQIQQLQVQAAKAAEEAQAGSQRVAQLTAQLEEKAAALQAAEVRGRCGDDVCGDVSEFGQGPLLVTLSRQGA